MNRVLWIVFGAIVVLGLSALIFFSSQEKANDPNANIDVTAFQYDEIITADNLPADFAGDKNIVIDHIQGKVDSSVQLVEWQNFQCSACYSLSPTMREITNEYKDRVAFVSRYLYLPGHPNGMAASVAAEAAARQGKFHDMSTVIFASFDEWNSADVKSRQSVFAQYAELLSLDMDKWNDDYENYTTNGIKTRLDFQSDLGNHAFKLLGENGYTPFIVVNGKTVDNTKEKIVDAIKEALGE